MRKGLKWRDLRKKWWRDLRKDLGVRLKKRLTARLNPATRLRSPVWKLYVARLTKSFLQVADLDPGADRAWKGIYIILSLQALVDDDDEAVNGERGAVLLNCFLVKNRKPNRTISIKFNSIYWAWYKTVWKEFLLFSLPSLIPIQTLT